MTETPIVEVRPEPPPPIQPFERWILSYDWWSGGSQKWLRTCEECTTYSEACEQATKERNPVIFRLVYPGEI